MIFRDRKEAGRLLAARLVKYADCPEVIVLGLPRGGWRRGSGSRPA